MLTSVPVAGPCQSEQLSRRWRLIIVAIVWLSGAILVGSSRADEPLSALRDGSAILRLRRGTPVVGTVLSPEGEPVAGAEVFYGEGSRFANAIPPIKTDAKGTFTLGIKEGTKTSLTARAPGFGPTHQPVRVGSDPLRVDLTLSQAHTWRGRVVDPSGPPVVGAHLVVSWHDLETLETPRFDVWMIRKSEIAPRNANEGQRSPIGLQVDEAGRLRAQDLKAGDYTLRVALHEPPPSDTCGWGALLGDFVRTFTVPGDGTDAIIDLGAIEPARLGGEPLKVGDIAPDFTVKTLAGKELSLADFRGKFVLLDFWATWCAPCVAEMSNLKEIHEQFSNDPRFVLVGLSLDERPDDARSFVKRENLPWLQGFTDPDAPIVSAYGATSIPATFLIGPDGKILARELRGERTKATVAEALKP